MPETENSLSTELEAALGTLLQLAGVTKSGSRISSVDVQIAVDKLKSRLERSEGEGSGSKKGKGQEATPAAGANGKISLANKTILIAGEVGIITFQLKQVLTRLGAEVVIAKGIDEAINEFQKMDFTQVLIDLYMPTEREGLIVLDEVNRLKTICNISVDILVLSTPTKEKKLKDTCKSHGATCYIEKTEGWHKRIVEFCLGKMPDEKN
ncbi:MAG: response regulator [Cyanobacteria bacterium]|nr:response regulator [Cyanobacteriota bacterium]